MGSKHNTTIGLLILSSIFDAFFVVFFNEIKTLFYNLGSTTDIPVGEVKTYIGMFIFAGALISGTVLAAHLRNKWKNKKSGDSKKETSVEDGINNVIKEIEFFIKKWRRGNFIHSSYRRQVEKGWLWKDRFLIRTHANEIRSRSKFLNSMPSEKGGYIFNTLNGIIDDMVSFGLDLELVFDTKKSISETFQSEPNRIPNLVSEGDVIVQRLRNTIPFLEKLKSII